VRLWREQSGVFVLLHQDDPMNAEDLFEGEALIEYEVTR
jgi:hypothetical protein